MKLLSRVINFNEDKSSGYFLLNDSFEKFSVSFKGLPRNMDVSKKIHKCRIIGINVKKTYLLEFS